MEPDFCRQGHDKNLPEGRTKNRQCRLCARENDKRHYRKTYVKRPKNPHCKNGHDRTLPGALNKWHQCILCGREAAKRSYFKKYGRYPSRKTHCIKGHPRTPENLYRRACKTCLRNACEAWHKAHPEIIRKKVRRWREANRDKILEYNRKWYRDHYVPQPQRPKKKPKSISERDFVKAQKPTEEERIEWEIILAEHGLELWRGTNPYKMFYGESRTDAWQDKEN